MENNRGSEKTLMVEIKDGYRMDETVDAQVERSGITLREKHLY